jgi:hypothetical protein
MANIAQRYEFQMYIQYFSHPFVIKNQKQYFDVFTVSLNTENVGFRGNFTLGLTNMRFIIHPSRPLTTRFTFFLSSFRHCYFKSLIKLN